MDRLEQERMLRGAMRELQEAQRKVVHLQQVVDGLQGLLYSRTETGSIVYFTERMPSSEVAGSGLIGMDFPSARDAIVTVFQRNPNRGLSSRQIFSLVQDYGLLNPELRSGPAAYDMALRRLSADPDTGVFRDEAAGTFIYRPNELSAHDPSWDRMRQEMHRAELNNFLERGSGQGHSP